MKVTAYNFGNLPLGIHTRKGLARVLVGNSLYNLEPAQLCCADTGW